MTATQQPRHPVTAFAKTVIGVFRTLNSELTAAGEAMVRPDRFPPPSPQPSPQAGLEQATQAHPAGKVPAGV
jgi:hypothetical protein